MASSNVVHANTPCITLTGQGSVADPLTATIVTDPACSLIACGPTGLCVTPAAVTVADTPSLDLTITGTGTVADPYVISGIAAGTTVLQALDTQCVDMIVTGSGTASDPYIVSADPIIAPDAPCNGLECGATGLLVAPSADAGNTLTCGTDGRLFVPAAAAAAITVADTNCINLTGDGTLATPLTADPIIAPDAPCNGLSCTAAGLAVIPSTDAGNNLTCGTDGNLYVPTAAATVATADTQCMQMNGDGSAGAPITAVPIIDPACTLLSCTAAGLCVTPTPVAVLDTPSLDLTVTGTGQIGSPFTISGVVNSPTVLTPLDTNCINMTIVEGPADTWTVSADPIVAPDAPCNGLECTAAGLAVIPSSDAGNTLVCGTDGRLFSPAAAVAPVLTADTNCINLSGDGTVTPLTADPIIDPACDLLTCGAAGLCVAPTPVAVLDTATLDLTLTGTGQPGDPWTISGVASVACVATPITVNPVATPGTACLTATGGGCPGDPYILTLGISAACGNEVQCLADGLFARTVQQSSRVFKTGSFGSIPDGNCGIQASVTVNLPCATTVFVDLASEIQTTTGQLTTGRLDYFLDGVFQYVSAEFPQIPATGIAGQVTEQNFSTHFAIPTPAGVHTIEVHLCNVSGNGSPIQTFEVEGQARWF